jgi:hypothetical protein
LADERAAQTDLFWLGYSGRQVPEVCQTRARKTLKESGSGVRHLVLFKRVKNFSGVLHLEQLRIPRQWVDSMGRHGVQFTAPVGLSSRPCDLAVTTS